MKILNKKDLNDCFDHVTPDFEQTKKMFNIIISNGEEDTRYLKRSRKKLRFATALIVICILTMSNVLAIHFGWHEKLIEYFNIREDQIGILENAVDTPEATISKNGITITVKQTLTDSMGIYALYEMSVPEDIELSDDVIWKFDCFNATTEQIGADYSTSVSGTTILEQSAHHRTALIYFLPSEPIKNGSMQLRFRDLIHRKTTKVEEELDINEEVIPLVEGEWNLSWDFTYKDTSKHVTPNQLVSINGKESTITKVSVSPMSISLLAQGENILEAIVTVNFKDGSNIIYNAENNNSSFGSVLINEDEMTYEYQLYYRFNQIINPDNVESITLGETKISME